MAKDSSIQKIKAQLKGVSTGLEDLHNQSKTASLIFTNIKKENESFWEYYSTAHYPSSLF